MIELDEIDRKMIDELRLDGRVSIPVLAERVGVSRATAYNRFDRLIDSGAIAGFSAVVNHKAVGLGVSALVMINADQGKWRELLATLQTLNGIEWVGVATGSFDFVVHTRASSLDELRDVVLEEMQSLDHIKSAETIVLLDEVDQHQRR